MLLSVHEYNRAKDWLFKYGSSVSFFSRLLPGIRTVISLPAGVAKIPLGPFVIWTFLGSLIWCYLLTYIGYYLGDNWESFEPVFAKFQYVIIFAGVLGIAVYVYMHFRNRPEENVKSAEKEKGTRSST